MKGTSILQDQLFDRIKKSLPKGVHLVDELEDILEVSRDSAYRRIRGETLLSILETQLLCEHYDFSMDEILDGSKSRITFSFQPISEHNFTFTDYLKYIMTMMIKIGESKDKEMLYLANDIPFFHLLSVPEIASFKLFFWQRTILNFESFRHKKFRLNEKDESINSISRKIRNIYFETPSTEIYSPETVDITLRQIAFYFDSGKFEDPNHALLLCNKVLELIDHLQDQCEQGYKSSPKSMSTYSNGDAQHHVEYKVYFNEVLFTDSTVLVRTDEQKITYLTNNGLNVLSTTDAGFYDENLKAFNILAQKSTLISGNSEKSRSIVFNGFRNKVDELKTKMKYALSLH